MSLTDAPTCHQTILKNYKPQNIATKLGEKLE